MGGTHVLREATVYEARLANGQVVPNPLGRGLLKRVVRDDVTASYLRIPIAAPLEPQLDLTVEPVATRPASLPVGRTLSVYRVRLPLERLPSARLVLTTTARVFTRQVTVGVEHGADRRRRDPWFETLASTNWLHADQESPAPALTMSLRPLDGRDVFPTADEGDNSPLPLESARLLLPSYRLRLFREREAALRLAYGRNVLGSPQYDLALIAPQLTGMSATEVVPGPEQSAAPSATTTLMSPQVFWGVLIVAVLILVALVVRLVRKSDVQSTPAT